MVHGSKNCEYWASWGPTIVFSQKKYKILNPVTLAHKRLSHGRVLKATSYVWLITSELMVNHQRRSNVMRGWTHYSTKGWVRGRSGRKPVLADDLIDWTARSGLIQILSKPGLHISYHKGIKSLQQKYWESSEEAALIFHVSKGKKGGWFGGVCVLTL